MPLATLNNFKKSDIFWFSENSSPHLVSLRDRVVCNKSDHFKNYSHIQGEANTLEGRFHGFIVSEYKQTTHKVS